MFFILLLISQVYAEAPETRSLVEATYSRDNSYCKMNGKSIELQIRGESKFTEPKEKGYGEYFFYYPTEDKAEILPLNSGRLDSFRFFDGKGSICSKSLAYKLDKETLAILFLKENKPFKDKLAIQLFNTQKMVPKEVIETDYLTDMAKKASDGFFFRTLSERDEPDMGKIQVEGAELFYQDRDLNYWVKYTLKGFEFSSQMSFKKFPWKELTKDLGDFLELTGWDEKTKTFKNRIIYVAVNHAQKKECILLLSEKKKLDGSEKWRCRK